MLIIINNSVNLYKSNSSRLAIDNIIKILNNIFIFLFKAFNIKNLYRRKRIKIRLKLIRKSRIIKSNNKFIKYSLFLLLILFLSSRVIRDLSYIKIDEFNYITKSVYSNNKEDS